MGIEELVGKTMAKVYKQDIYGDELVFETVDGRTFKLLHYQDCCEDVVIDDIVGDLNDLVGSPILLAEESVSDSEYSDEWYGSVTWTFYKFATIKGYVDVKWHGSSNGYYSESVDFAEVDSEL